MMATAATAATATVVCNSKVSYIRPEFNNLEECLNDKNNVYIGRKGIVFIDGKRFPPFSSVWANPYKVGKDGSLEVVLLKYKNYIINKIKKENLNIETLRGKRLYCWCINNNTYCENINNCVCHGQILLGLLSLHAPLPLHEQAPL